MPLEILSVDKAIVNAIENDTILPAMLGGSTKLFVDIANENESTKFWITFQVIDAPDTNAMGGQHIISKPIYLIKVCNRDLGYGVLRAPCDRIFDLLTKEPHGNIEGIWVGKFVRTNVMRDHDEIKNLKNYWIGQLFMLISHEV